MENPLTLDMGSCQGYERKKAGESCGDTADKLFYKAQLILNNQEELGLSGEQIKKIKDLKLKAKKDSIRADAEIKIIALDIKAKMGEEKLDATAVGKLIDEKYELKKAKAKSSAKAYAELKGILTEEQDEKLKGLWKKCKTEQDRKHKGLREQCKTEKEKKHHQL